MKINELSPTAQGQLALAIAGILAQGATHEEIEAMLLITQAVKDNLTLYAKRCKKNSATGVSRNQS